MAENIHPLLHKEDNILIKLSDWQQPLKQHNQILRNERDKLTSYGVTQKEERSRASLSSNEPVEAELWD